MSKPLSYDTLLEINESEVNRKNEILLQTLSLLENLKDEKENKFARISSELSVILENEKNYAKITNSKNLDELLNTLIKLQKNAMIKVYAKDYLMQKFPLLAKNAFID